MNAKISKFVIYDEVIIYLSLYNLHDCTFQWMFFSPNKEINSFISKAMSDIY